MIRRSLGTMILGVLVLLGTAWRTEALPFTTVGDGWDGPGRGSATLTFAFGTPTLDLPLHVQRAAIITALDVWAAVVNLTFTETTFLGLDNSIDFNFLPGGFESNFLAFAFFPAPNGDSIAGDVFFLDDWLWEVGDGLGFQAYDLERVALHEIGHSLGLGHSDVMGSVMWPFTGSWDTNTGLHPVDVAGIQSLYAAVPESSSSLLVLTGLSALTLCQKRRKRTGNRQQFPS